MEWILEYLKHYDFFHLILIGGIIWFFTRPIKKKVQEVELRIGSIESKLTSIDRRLLILETRFEERGKCEKHTLDPSKALGE